MLIIIKEKPLDGSLNIGEAEPHAVEDLDPKGLGSTPL